MDATAPDALPYTGDPEADALLAAEPLALLIGFVLDQQVSVQKAFSGPLELQRRIGTLDAATIAAMDPADLEAAFRERPALHRFPGSMAKRTRALCEALVADYDGEAAALWTNAADGDELRKRLERLPGFGKAKARIFVGVVGKRLAAGPPGWEDAAADWPSIADVDDFEKVYELRERKRAMKAAAKKEAGQ